MTEKQRVLVTRARPGADATAKRLKEAGHSPIVLPLLQLRPSPLSPELQEWLSTYRGDLIFTSANGVRFAPVSLPHGSNKVWCVGDATAKAAKKAGFDNVLSANGSAKELLELIMSKSDPNTCKFLHLGHAQPRGFIADTLISHGFSIEHIALYDARPTPDYANRLSQVMGDNSRIDAVMIHSPASGARFADVWKRHGLGDVEPPIIAAISNAAGDPLRHLAGRRLKIASSPTETALIRLINTG